MAKPRHIQSPEKRARFVAEGCFAIGMAVSGLELTTRGLYMYTREGQMYLDCRRASQANRANQLFEDREGNIWVATRERPRSLSRLCYLYIFCESRFFESQDTISSCRQGWRHLAGHS